MASKRYRSGGCSGKPGSGRYDLIEMQEGILIKYTVRASGME